MTSIETYRQFFCFSSLFMHLILQIHGLHVFDKFSRKVKPLRVDLTLPLLHETRGRHCLTFPLATPLRNAQNQSKYLRPSLRNQPFWPPRPPPSTSLAVLSLGALFLSLARQGRWNGRTGTPLPSGRGYEVRHGCGNFKEKVSASATARTSFRLLSFNT